MRLLALGLCLALVLPACTEDKVIIVTGESLITTGDQFIEVGAAMNAALDAKSITPAAYKEWAAFARKFKLAYPAASNLWNVAADNKDETLKAQASAAIAGLVGQLAEYAVLVGVKL